MPRRPQTDRPSPGRAATPRTARFAAALLVGAAALSLAHPALAQATGGAVGGNIESFLQNVVTLLTGNVARLLATIAVIIVGVAWMFGHLDLRRAGVVVIGIILIFGAAQIVSLITGGAASA